MSKSSFPKLAQFLGAYFHQDWTLEASSSAEVISNYAKRASGTNRAALAGEVKALRAEKLKEPQLAKRLTELGACLEPSAEGLTCTAWLAALETALETGGKPRPGK